MAAITHKLRYLLSKKRPKLSFDGHGLRRNPYKVDKHAEFMCKWQGGLDKVLMVMDGLRNEPEQVMEFGELLQWSDELFHRYHGDPIDFLHRNHAVFDVFMDCRKLKWFGLTPLGQELMREKEEIIKAHEAEAVVRIRKLLMLSNVRRLKVRIIENFREAFLLPNNFQESWIYKFPQYFRVLKEKGVFYLELTSWDPALAITELEKQAIKNGLLDLQNRGETPGWLRLPFPLKFPSRYRRSSSDHAKAKNFQQLAYLSPYADPSNLEHGTKETSKRAAAVLHEILSLTVEKKIRVDHISRFHITYRLPRKMVQHLLLHFGIFYVSTKGRRYNVLLTSAYGKGKLIEKNALREWKEKVARLLHMRVERPKNRLSLTKDCLDGGTFDIPLVDAGDTEDNEIAIGASDSGEMHIDAIMKDYDNLWQLKTLKEG